MVQLRLNNAQYSYAYLKAEGWGCPVGEAIRRLIDQALDAETAEVDGVYVGDRPATLREALQIGEPTAEWIAEFMSRHPDDAVE